MHDKLCMKFKNKTFTFFNSNFKSQSIETESQKQLPIQRCFIFTLNKRLKNRVLYPRNSQSNKSIKIEFVQLNINVQFSTFRSVFFIWTFKNPYKTQKLKSPKCQTTGNY